MSLPLILLATLAHVAGLKDVSVRVPPVVAVGDTVVLGCSYDLEGAELYSLKWYKGRREFFRYVPKDLPHTQVFPLYGVKVDMARSSPRQVVLLEVPVAVTGNYSCEVSADAPGFDTALVFSFMQVVQVPDGEPNLLLEKSRFYPGDTLRVNCTVPPSIPPANISWLLNGHPAEAKAQWPGASLLEAAVPEGRLTAHCLATVFHLYRGEASLSLHMPGARHVLATPPSKDGSCQMESAFVLIAAAVCLLVASFYNQPP